MGLFAESTSTVSVNQKQDVAYNPSVVFNTNPVVEPPGGAARNSGELSFAGTPAAVRDVSAQIPTPSSGPAESAASSPFSGRTVLLIGAAVIVYLLLKP